MQINTPTLFVEINKSEFIFLVGKLDENNIFEIIHKNNLDLKGIIENKVINFEEIKNIIKDKLYNLEQKSDFIFKEVILVINNFDCSIINFSGFKKLNGSQLNKENITYILNVLKTKISRLKKKQYYTYLTLSLFWIKKILKIYPLDCLVIFTPTNYLFSLLIQMTIKIYKIFSTNQI